MKYPWLIAIISVLIEFASAGTLLAGVVMGETSIEQAPNGDRLSEGRTIYIEGNKQKIEEQGVATITDLDESVIYVVDENDRQYTEMPLRALSSAEPGNPQSSTVLLSKTGVTKSIASQPCNEYRGVQGNEQAKVTISACVSTTAPGAKEVTEFDRKMIAELSGRDSEQSINHDTVSLMLEKQSIVRVRVRDRSRGEAFRTASVLAQTRINKIQLKPLPPETFTPPKGYTKLQNGSPQVPPTGSPLERDKTV